MHSVRPTPAPRRSQAFTLMEMVLVMFVLTMLLSAIFAIIRGTVELTDDIAVAQARDARLEGFGYFCERTLRNLPAHSMLRHRNQQLAGRYLSQMVLVDAPSPLSDMGRAAEVMIIETEEAPDGYLRVVLRALDVKQAAAWEQGAAAGGTRLVLLENVAFLEWRFLNPFSGEWEPLWNAALPLPLDDPSVPPLASPPMPPDPPDASSQTPPLPPAAAPANPMTALQRGQRPGLIELRLAVGVDEPQRWLFWTPPLPPR